MSRYAANTSVPSDRSRSEIERTLARYGAEGFMYGWTGGQAQVAFRAHDRNVVFRLAMPDRAAFALTETGKKRTAASAEAAYEQAVRQRWRALALVVKAKLEAVAAGIAEFEDEFLAYIALPDGSTVADRVRPEVEKAYATGSMPTLALPMKAGS